jgi:S1-C subfamily serine protease
MAMPALRSFAATAALLLMLADACPALDDDARGKAKQELQAINAQISILSHAFNLIHEVVAPSVVSIHTRATVSSQFPWEGRREAQVEVGEGSGFVVAADDKDSYILTNAHVVLQTNNGEFVHGVNDLPVGYDSIVVQCNDNRVVDATYVGYSIDTDLAVLKIAVPRLPVVDWGDSDHARVGDWVLALGYPFGVGYSATSGIVSATDRSTGVYESVQGLESFIQTDAAINPGNSGGPLVGLDGRILGVNSSIISRAGGNVGIGFAIPANLARHVAEDLIAVGHVRWPGIGIDMDTITSEQAEALGLPAVQTVRITRVLPQTPAATSDLAAKDLVLAVNQMPIQSLMSFRARIASCRIGDPLTLKVWRDGKVIERKVVPIDREQILALRRAAPEPAGQDQDVDLPGFGMHLGTDDAPGLVVTDVTAGGVADQAKLQLGDRLLHERTLKDLRTRDDAAELATRHELVVEVLRDGRGFWVRLKRP